MSASDPAADRYLDLDGSGGKRWWDGQHRTKQRRPTATPQVRTLGMVAVTLTIGVVAMLAACSPHENSSKGSSSQSIEAPAPQQRTISGTPDDWLTALCQPGQFYENAKTRVAMPGAVGGASCIPRIPTSSRNTPLIWISQFDSEFKMRNALPARLAKYAATTQYDGLIWTFSIIDSDPSPLQPLKQFGFTIESVPGISTAPSSPTYAPNVPPALPRASVPSPNTSGRNTDGQLHWRFQSKTGNIACDLDGSSGEGIAVCEVRGHAYKPEVKSSCQPSWVNFFALRQGKTVVVNCYADTTFQGTFPVQNYGHPVTVGSITCIIDETTGVTCRDATTGHYFQATRQSYQWH